MNAPSKSPTLEEARVRIGWKIRRRGLLEEEAMVAARELSPEEAIGRPARKDYPILKGKERVIEARALGHRGQAFTDAPVDFTGTLQGVLEMPLEDNHARAVFTAVLNAVCAAEGVADRTVHCRDGDPELCAARIADRMTAEKRASRIGLLGLNPAIAGALHKSAGGLRLADLDPDNIGTSFEGVEIENGETAVQDIIRWADTMLVTGTTFVNGTFDAIEGYARKHGKPLIIYGMTGAGVCALLDLPRLCFFGGDG